MCESVWEAGIPVSSKPASEIVSLRYITSGCRSKLNNKFLLIKLDSMRKDDFLKLMGSLMLSSPPPLEDVHHGVYTWIIYSTSTQKHQFAALKVRSFLELGTIHNALVALTGATRLHAAGEFRIPAVPETYHVNFESGTFMTRILHPEDYLDEGPGILTPGCARDGYMAFLKEKVASIFPGKVEFVASTLIGAVKPTLITSEELDLYRTYGARIQIFDTQEQCTKAEKGGRRKTRRRKMGGRKKTTKSSRVRG